MDSDNMRPEHVPNRSTILGVMSAGHGVAHLYDQGVPVMMPSISSHFGLNTFQISVLLALRFVGFGVVNIGGGLVVDMLKRYWGIMLTGCMVAAAIFFALLGAAPGYIALILVVPLVSIPGALWHLPSAASLSQVFSDRRGFAISIHGLGSNLGNMVGPIIATGLLSILTKWKGLSYSGATIIPTWIIPVVLRSWRGVMYIYVLPALIMGVLVWIYLRHVGRIGSIETRDLSTQIRESLSIMRHPGVILLVAAAMLRGVGLDAVFAWSPFYLTDTLGKAGLEYGFHYALISGMGIVSAPILGYLSDRFSRKAVMVPGFILAAAVSFVTVAAGDGIWLIPVLAGTGLFSFALHQIVQAAVLDVVGRGTEATAVGLIFGLNGILGAASPFLGYFVIENFGGYGAVYYYAGILTAISAVLVIVAPIGQMVRRQPPTPDEL